MGFSLGYGIVKRSDGRIRVQSRIGEGTTFRIYLPDVCSTWSTDGKAKTSRVLSHLLPLVFVSPTPDDNWAGNSYSENRKEDNTTIRDRGSTRAFRKRTDQCRCGPVTRPVAPTLPITVPFETRAFWLTLKSFR